MLHLRIIFLAAVMFSVISFQNCSMVTSPEIPDVKQESLGSMAVLESKAFQVISSKCVSCHNPGMPSGGIDYLTDLDALLYYRLVVPGEPQLSPLYTVIQSGEMPPEGRLSQQEIQIVHDWVLNGFVDGTGPVSPPTNPPSTTLEAKFASINNLILKTKCLVCHNSNNSMGGVNFSTYQTTMNTVQPANPNASSLYTSVNSGSMPQGGARLTNAEITAIRTWIQNGAQNN